MHSRKAIVAAAALAAAWIAAPVVAQDNATMFSKADVQNIVASKKMAYVRTSDQKTIEYDLRSGGDVYYALSTNGGRNLSMRGNYEVTDDGQLCFKWQPDRYITLPDACYSFRRDGDKVLVVGPRNPKGHIGELVQ